MRARAGAALWATLLVVPGLSSACKPVDLEHEVRFAPGSTALAASEIRSLVDWYIEKRDGPGIRAAGVYAKAPRGKTAVIGMAEKRIASIVDLVKTLNTSIAAIPSGGSVEEVDRTKPQYPEEWNSASVIVQPACLETDSCCAAPIK